jgi:hypothetical protein
VWRWGAATDQDSVLWLVDLVSELVDEELLSGGKHTRADLVCFSFSSAGRSEFPPHVVANCVN